MDTQGERSEGHPEQREIWRQARNHINCTFLKPFNRHRNEKSDEKHSFLCMQGI